MWCTRWFLPLLLLPLPTAPPLFLLLFLFSLTLHAKPCFYCIVLLSTLFVTSCYWQPFPLDTPLAVPWSADISTFSHALNASLSSNISRPVPTVIRAVDRCWCDFSNGFFEPFNVSHWEFVSVYRLKSELERPPQDINATFTHNATASAHAGTARGVPARLQLKWTLLKEWIHRSRRAEQKREDEEALVVGAPPGIRKEYDLRSYGFDVILDFSW
ncbi:hypothetical protein AX14_000025 [Amanita brunnescens Koide BX004]|nr:hypothetical protein AX14_000025 [Amanita brunnescens Koide BX004]